VDVAEFFLEQHARSHAAALTGATEPLLEDQLLAGLTDADLRARPRPGLNSIAWLLWHLARSEDVAVNVLVAEQPQVLEEEGWLGRLGLSQRAMGTGMSDREVEEVSARLDLTTLRAYRLAVGARTREVVLALPAKAWDRPVNASLLLHVQAFSDQTEGERRVQSCWQGRTTRFVLASSVTTHSYLHFGEAGCLKALLAGG
jgi:hypothetical protein